MSLQTRAFKPLATTQNTAVGASATTVTLNYALGSFQVRFSNVGTQTVFVLPGDNATQVAATVSNAIPIPAGQTEIFTFPTSSPSYSVIAGATGSTLYSTVGEGI